MRLLVSFLLLIHLNGLILIRATRDFIKWQKKLPENRIPSNLANLLILEVIGRSDRAMTATEINDEIGLPKQTVHRLVSTLKKRDF